MQADPLYLSIRQTRFFHENGYLYLEDFVDPIFCEGLRQRANELAHQFEPESISIFSTKNQTETSDTYFMESGDKIRFFFEEDGFTAEGQLKQAKEQSINKIGHALHELDPLFRQFSCNKHLEEIVRDLGIKTPLLAQSMYIFKQPRIGGEVQCHQDSSFLYTEPMSVVGLWFALQDATIENGCLWVLPGVHHAGIKSRFLRKPRGKSQFEIYDKGPWPMEKLIPLEVPQGSLIILHGSLPHMSRENRTSRSRHAYSIHVIDAECDYPADNWLQRPPGMPFQGFQCI